MNKSIFGVIGFVLGAAAGSLVTWKVIEKKYQQIADEEVASVKKAYSEQMAEKNRELKAETFPVTVNTESPITEFDTGKLKEIIDEYSSNEKPDYSAYSQAKGEKQSEDVNNDPYVIIPNEFGEFDDYEQIELTYYKDGVLAEGTDIVTEDLLGDIDPGDHFGEYEIDRVFVRDDARQVDYEIIRDERTYMEVI